MLRARHLQENRLFDCYLAEQEGEPLEPPAAEHLADCAACGARYADLRRFMDDLRVEADADLDALFPPERLRAQQQHIARRMEHLGHAARVISFPGHPPGHPAVVTPTRLAARWIAAAAAAGLFFGIGLGGYWHASAPRRAQIIASAMPSAAAPSIASAKMPQESPADSFEIHDQFLSEVEVAMERPHTPELAVLDELTPHVREVSVTLR
jgi:anti-sigma factor RsiW